MINRLLLSFVLTLLVLPVAAQWTNRYPKVKDHGHHVYLEGFELPIMNSGPTDPAPSPLNDTIAFAAKGWLWLYDQSTGIASRITFSPGMDSRPEWSPDGNKLVFVRDDSKDTQIVLLDLENNQERVVVDEPAIDLDPVFSPDSQKLYYTSAASGSLNLWSVDLESGEKLELTNERGIQRRPIPLARSNQLVYLNKVGSNNGISMLNLTTGSSKVLVEDGLTPQADMSISPNGALMAYAWPVDHGNEIRLLALETPNASLRLSRSDGMPLMPAFSHDGLWVYFVEANSEEQTQLKRVSVNGGKPETIMIRSWLWNEPTGRVKIITKVDGITAATRLNVLNTRRHPLLPEQGAVRLDGQHGKVFFYSKGEIELETVAGTIVITATQGFLTKSLEVEAQVSAGNTSEITINLEKIWDPGASGWYSGDNHFHLNYGGTYQLDPEDIQLDMLGEGLDVGYPLLANLHNRFLQQELWGWKSQGLPLISFGQEVRSHFLGHVALIGTKELFWPWIWGPYYQVYGTDDRTNAEPLGKAREQGGLGGYVHPVENQNPFSEEGAASVPVNLIADCVLGEADLLEVGCLWTDELGTGAIWHEVLNIGVPLAASSGSDVMNDYYHTMAVGATRMFVKPGGPLNEENYLKALKHGNSFVSNGPMLEFVSDGKEPGEVITTDSKTIKWWLKVHSAVPYENVEILVNGQVVWSKQVKIKPGTHDYKGTLKVPVGGWVTARVHGGVAEWPFMDSYPFAESSPIWFDKVGSVDPVIAKSAARKLSKLLAISRQSLKLGYGENPIPNLLNQFDRAESKLAQILDQ